MIEITRNPKPDAGEEKESSQEEKDSLLQNPKPDAKKARKMKAVKKKNTILSKTLNLDAKKKSKIKKKFQREERMRNPGPRLPSSLQKELDFLNPNPKIPDPDSESDGPAEGHHEDLYEYDEPVPQEESKKNRRFDPVENYEYELPEDFKDENIPSDDDEELPSDQSEDEERHQRMLEGVTGMPSQAFVGQERKKVVLSDTHGIDGNDKPISIQDLLDPLHGKPGYNKLRKRFQQLDRKGMAVQAPLPKVERERLERKVAYEQSKKDITKWEPLVKRNREAPTLYFEEDVDLGFSTVGAIASEFEPRTEFEKKMALLVRDPEVMEAHWKDGSKLLELNKISIEDVRDRQNHLGKLRNLLFRHEVKAKRIKKIKSKTYHRLLKKERSRAASTEMNMDPEAAKEYHMKQEFKRAQERMTLKHKNSSAWARRILKRGLDVQDEGTRAAISEQLHQHALLTRKMNTIKDNDSSSMDDTSDDDVGEDFTSLSNIEGVSKILNKAKEKTSKVMEEEDEIPKSGLLTLPFMERGLKKREKAADEEARLARQEYDSSLNQLEDCNVEDGNAYDCPAVNRRSGRKVFGAARNKSQESNKRSESKSSDSEDEFEAKEHEEVGHEANQLREVQIGSALNDESEMGDETIYKSFDDIIKDPSRKTTYEVAIFASDSWKKMKGENAVNGTTRPAVKSPVLSCQELKGMDQNSDSDSDEEMVDGILSSGAKLDYKLPSQTDLIHRAFAGDDVEAEFEKDKMDILNEENPEPEKPLLLPGWGQWTHVQQKKGMPSWMLEEDERANRKREEALKKRKDAPLKHVIISEKSDKKVEKFYPKALPYPYTSKEVYEQSIRMPIGPEFNPAASFGALNRPAIVKKSGVIIKPIQYKEVDPHEKGEESNRRGQKPKATRRKI